jgi:undecaprenyl-diphosphatase
VLHRVEWLNTPVVDLTRIATDGAIFIVIGAVLAIVWRRPWFFVTLVAATLAADGLSLLLRHWIGRDRPPLVYPDPRPLVGVPHSGAFPSGHAATAFAAATVIAWESRRLAIPAYALAALVAWSRVYVGVHWPLDVIGGAALGTLVAIALLKLLEAPRRSLRAPQEG